MILNIYTSLGLSSAPFCQYDLSGADLWCCCFTCQPGWISASFPHAAIAISCLWTEMFAVCPAEASPLDCEHTAEQIFFRSSWLLENEIHFGSSPQQAMRLYLQLTTWSHAAPWAPSPFHRRLGMGSTSQSWVLWAGNTYLQWAVYKRALLKGKQNSRADCL